MQPPALPDQTLEKRLTTPLPSRAFKAPARDAVLLFRQVKSQIVMRCTAAEAAGPQEGTQPLRRRC